MKTLLYCLTLACVSNVFACLSLAQDTDPINAESASTADETAVANAESAETEDPPYRNLDAALYMQCSAEYHAICLQTYNLANSRIEAIMSKRDDPRPAAVVLDLDETVLNNGAYQSWQIQNNSKFNQDQWTVWEDSGLDYVPLIPGAKEFIEKLKSLNVQPVYITNRNANSIFQTMSILEKHGIQVDEHFLMCADSKTGSNKTSRRAELADKYDIVLLVGDNLRDFDEIFKYAARSGVDGRKKLVEDHREYWGKRWIILPNPAYGEWMKPLGNGKEDLQYLMPAFPMP